MKREITPTRHCDNPVRIEPACVSCLFCGRRWEKKASPNDERLQWRIDKDLAPQFNYGRRAS